MPVKTYKPTSPALRGMTVVDYRSISKKKPEKSLLKSIKRSGGRNSYGRITVRHIGGGNKRKIRLIDWKREKDGIPAKVVSIEYDPNRTSFIALLQYTDGEKRYILAPEDVKTGDVLMSGAEAEVKAGNALPLQAIPVGTEIHNIEMKIGKGAQLVRTAGAVAQLVAKDKDYCHVKLPSGEVRLLPTMAKATIGRVGNGEHENVHLGKAGRKRHMGKRPKVRGVVMNPNDHPHGGGEGKSPVGLPSPVTPWGVPTMGKKTRNRKKQSNKYIVRRRNQK